MSGEPTEIRDVAIVEAIGAALEVGELILGPFEEDESLALSLHTAWPMVYSTGSESIDTLAADIEYLIGLAKHES